MRKNRKKNIKLRRSIGLTPPQEQLKTNCFQGECLTVLLGNICREIELAKLSKGDLPDKIWIKQQLSIGVNDVTRVLERMPCVESVHIEERPPVLCNGRKAPLVPLQAVLLASDCNPSWLTKHIPSLASSRRVPVIFVKDKQGGSLRLGELVKLRTAMAIGVKARGSRINEVVDEVLHANGLEGASNAPTLADLKACL